MYGYSHILVYAGITATGVGIQTAIEHATEGALDQPARAALAGGAAVFLLGTSAIDWAAPQSLPRTVLLVRLLAACICGALVIVGGMLPAALLAALITTIFIGLILFEAASARTTTRETNAAALGETVDA